MVASAGDPYGTPPPPTNYGDLPPANPYGTPPPAYSPYAQQQVPYNAPYGTPPPYPAPGTYQQPPQQFVPIQQPPQKKGLSGCAIALIVVLILLVVGVGSAIGVGYYAFHKVSSAVATASSDYQSAVPTFASDLTGTPGDTGTVPTSGQIDPTAATMITSYQTATGIDENYGPVGKTTTFTTADKMYVTFKMAGQAGYILSKWYLNSQPLASSILTIEDGDDVGYVDYTSPNAGQVIVGLYWCTQSDCSDAALAQVAQMIVE